MTDVLGVEVWRGGVNTWECDENGHLNVRYYVALVEQALGGLAAALGLPHAFRPSAGATLIFREQHVRFLREVMAATPLYMTAGVVEIGETDAKVLFVLRRARDDEPCASYLTRLAHVTAVELRPFPWTEASRARAERLVIGELPSFAGPRSVPGDAVESAASLERAEALGLTRLALGSVLISDVDNFGRMASQVLIGRISDGIVRIVSHFRETTAACADSPPKRFGGAVLEQRMIYLRWPKIGDRIEIRSGVADIDGRFETLVHWLLDPDSGRAYAVSLAKVVTFDLDARKIVPVSERAQAIIREQVVEGLTL